MENRVPSEDGLGPWQNVSDSDDEDTALSFTYKEERRVSQSILMSFTWATLGLIFSLPGPTLLAISCNLCEQLNNIGILFVARGFGTLAGALIGRSLIYQSKRYGVLLISLLILAITISVFPVLKTLGAAAGVMFLIGLAYGSCTEGYVIMDSSNSLQAKNDLNKQILAFSLGVAAAPFIAFPFIEDLSPFGSRNGTEYTLRNITHVYQEGNRICEIFPEKTCFATSNFGKTMWLATIPCCMLIVTLIIMMMRKSGYLTINPSNTPIMKRPVDFKVYALRFVSFGVMFFYQGSFIITAVVMFSYVMLGPFELGKIKAAIFVSFLWVSFSFGLLMLQLLLKRVRRPEKRLGIAVFKSSICFISAILLLKIEDRNGQTLTLFIFMFFMADVSTIVQDVILSQAILSTKSINTLQIIATSFAEILLPHFSLVLMYHKGWHGMTFAIIFVTLMLFLSCTILALCPATMHQVMVSMSYQNLTETVEDGNGKKLRKQVKSLLGGYTDQDSTFEASEDEVLFDKKRHKTY